MEAVSNQLFIFVVLVCSGFMIGVLFDLYRVLRGRKNPGIYITAIIDGLLWIKITAAVFLILLAINWGEVRGYIFLFLILGLFLYYLLISKYVIQGYISLFNLISKFSVRLLTPFSRISRKIMENIYKQKD